MTHDAQLRLAEDVQRLRALAGQLQQQHTDLKDQIAEAQRIAEDLWLDNQQLRTLLHSMFDGYVIVDRRWRLMAVHVPMASGLPHPPTDAEVLGRVLWDIIPDTVGTPGYEQLQLALRDNIAVEFEGFYARWNRSFAIRARPFQNAFHICFHDITERKQAEEQRLTLERKLAEAKKWESLAGLAGGLAHDFNNLLSAIMGHSGLARMDLPADAPARLHLEGIEAAARRAALLTNQLLAYSGRARFVSSRVEINTIVAEAMAMLSGLLDRNTALQENLAAGLPPIEADADQLRQVLFDLLANAIEAVGPKMGGVIAIATRLRHADRAALSQTLMGADLPERDYVQLEVVDNGCGMDEATLTRMFDPFFSTKFTGRGLGLAAVLGIIRKHRGTLHVDSAPERGTAIQVWLPVATNCQL